MFKGQKEKNPLDQAGVMQMRLSLRRTPVQLDILLGKYKSLLAIVAFAI